MTTHWPKFWTAVNLAIMVLAVVIGANTPVANAQQHYIDLDATPSIPEGWSILENRKGGGYLYWNRDLIELWLAPGQELRLQLRGTTLRKMLAKKPVLNANVLDYLLAHPESFPKEWGSDYVFFWGTIYADKYGEAQIRCVYRMVDGRVRADYHAVNDVWNRGDSPAAVAVGAVMIKR